MKHLSEVEKGDTFEYNRLYKCTNVLTDDSDLDFIIGRSVKSNGEPGAFEFSCLRTKYGWIEAASIRERRHSSWGRSK